MKRNMHLFILAIAFILVPVIAGATSITFTGDWGSQVGDKYSFDIHTITGSADSAHPGSFTVTSGSALIDQANNYLILMGTLNAVPFSGAFFTGNILSVSNDIINGSGSINWYGKGVADPAISTFFFSEPNLRYDYVSTATFAQGSLTTYTLTSVPVLEPSTMMLLGSGLVSMATFGRKKFFKK